MASYVMKFGGSCVKDGSSVRRSAEIVRDYVERGCRVVAVVSALSGVTDGILEALESAERGREDYVHSFIENLRARHENACMEAMGKKDLRKSVWEMVEREIEEFGKLLSITAYLREVTPRIRDYALSFGERLSTRIFWGSLVDQGVKAEYLTGWDAGIITNDDFGSAKPLGITYQEVRRKLGPLLEKGIVPVVTGFIASTPDGVITTLGRGGSDYTATIIGAALKVDEIILWKDVDGIMTADPKLVPEAKPIPRMSYDEVLELAYFGAKVIHPGALEPASKENIPIRVKNFYNPSIEGTLITGMAESDTVKALTMIRDAAIILASGIGASEAMNANVKLLDLLARIGAQVIMVSQASSQANISIALPREDLKKALKAIKSEFAQDEIKIDYEEGICVIAVIGSGMRGKPGVAAKIFNAVAAEGINIKMIAQGSSELNISFAVKEEDGVKALRAVHKAFGLNVTR
ncbi:MAG: aspartate kinase [Thaumarchaeota archaeon]|jgi:aspartate kinase|nr:aspartate kinase [Candidatus Wolframiiraptor allenii]